MDWEATYKELSKANWSVLAILSLGSFLLFERSISLGVMLGGLVIIANFHALQHTIKCGFSDKIIGKNKKILIIFKSYLRLIALGVIIYILITRELCNPIGLAVGLSTVFFGIVIFGIKRAIQTKAKPREAIS